MVIEREGLDHIGLIPCHKGENRNKAETHWNRMAKFQPVQSLILATTLSGIVQTDKILEMQEKL